MQLSGKKYLRYERHIDLPGVGEAGQQTLLNACVLIVGAGGLGTPAAAYLAGAGIGKLIIVDDDTVHKTNLQRQILYREIDQGKSKAECLRARLLEINPDITVEAIPERLTRDNIEPLIQQCNLVLDGSDNFATKYLLNEFCLRYKKPLVYGAVAKFDGQLSVFQGYASDQPCYQCLYKNVNNEDVAACIEAPVLGPLVGVIGAMQAVEAIKVLLGLSTLAGRVILVNALNMYVETIGLPKDKACSACGRATKQII